MFNELRVVARLYRCGLDNQEIAQRVFYENLFQYPTERELRGKCRVALRRLGHITCSDVLLTLLTEGSACEARQVALVAMMSDSLLLYEFMVDVVGEKYRKLDFTLTRKDINLFSPAWRKRTKALLPGALQPSKKQIRYHEYTP